MQRGALVGDEYTLPLGTSSAMPLGPRYSLSSILDDVAIGDGFDLFVA